MSKSIKTLSRLALLFTVAALLALPAVCFAAEPPEDYTRVQLADLLENGKVTCDRSTVTLAKEDEAMTISGKAADLEGAVLSIDKTFNFDAGQVGRFTFTGQAQKGKKVVLGFYLDNADTPFYTAQLLTSSSKSRLPELSHSVVSQNITGTHSLTVKIEKCSVKTSFSLKSIEFSLSSVPVVDVYIDESLGTVANMNNSPDHSATCYGSVAVDVPTGCTSAMTGKPLTGTSGYLDLDYIRGRGNSTWHADKRPYKFKLEKKADLLGMGKNKHWALMANAYDSTLSRNIMTACMGEAVDMPFSPSMEPVELIMNGEYLGTYLLSEVTRADENRVEIADIDDGATSEPEITGGYLLSLGNWTLDDNKLNFKTKQAELIFQIESPDLYSSENQVQYNYIKDYVQAVEDKIYAHEDFSDLMDLRQAAMYYWFEELSRNGDGFTSGSCYLYKDRNGKLMWGPIWDFDLAWGAMASSLDDAGGWGETSGAWNQYLFSNSDYFNMVKEVWPIFKKAAAELTKPGGTIETLAKDIETAQYYEFQKWQGKAGEPANQNPDQDDFEEPTNTFAEDVQFLSDWIDARSDWIDEHIDELLAKPATITFEAEGKLIKTVNTFVGWSLGVLPEAPEKKGYCFDKWQYIHIVTLQEILDDRGLTEEEYRFYLIEEMGYTPEEADEYIARLKKGIEKRYDAAPYTPAEDGMRFIAVYSPESELEAVTQIFTLRDTYNGVCGDGFEDWLPIEYQIAPFYPTGFEVKMISSDESIVQSTSGMDAVKIAGPGDCTVTIKPRKGISKTVNVHIYTPHEYADIFIPYDRNLDLDETPVTLKVDEYKALPLTGLIPQIATRQDSQFMTSNPDVVEVGNFGVVHAVAPGTATIICTNESRIITTCTVTVKDPGKVTPTPSKVVTRYGKKYEILTKSKSSHTVQFIGTVKKSVKTLKIPATITIKGVKYKVVRIKKKAMAGRTNLTSVTIGKNVRVIEPYAFKGCKKLKTAILGRGIHIVESGAFKSCKALKKVTIKSKQKPKIYKSAFKYTNKKLKYYVYKSQLKYYKMILPKKRVRTI